MYNNLKDTKQTVTVVKISNFELIPQENGENVVVVPEHFIHGGFYIAVKHETEEGPLFRVFFNKITGNTTKNSFFKEVKSNEVSGLFISQDNDKNIMWNVDMEEFDFKRVEEYDVSEKALYFMSDLMLMEIDKFKDLADEHDKEIVVRDPRVPIDEHEEEEFLEKMKDIAETPDFIYMDEAVMRLQDHILSAMEGKYQKMDVNPAEALIMGSSGKSINIFNAFKYLTRYFNDEGKKSNDYNDLLKAAHYILFEMARRNKFKTNE